MEAPVEDLDDDTPELEDGDDWDDDEQDSRRSRGRRDRRLVYDEKAGRVVARKRHKTSGRDWLDEWEEDDEWSQRRGR